MTIVFRFIPKHLVLTSFELNFVLISDPSFFWISFPFFFFNRINCNFDQFLLNRCSLPFNVPTYWAGVILNCYTFEILGVAGTKAEKIFSGTSAHPLSSGVPTELNYNMLFVINNLSTRCTRRQLKGKFYPIKWRVRLSRSVETLELVDFLFKPWISSTKRCSQHLLYKNDDSRGNRSK